MKRGKTGIDSIDHVRLREFLGQDLINELVSIQESMHSSVYLTGGTVRDILLGREPVDIDLTVNSSARKWAAELARVTGGTYVPLGRDEDAARVVWLCRDIDFSSFRQGAETIEEELAKRDITVNSLAVSLATLLHGDADPEPAPAELIDPLGGVSDLRGRIIRMTSKEAFRRDPLRLLRVYRFAATLGFTVDRETEEMVVSQKEWVARPAPERVAHELDLIMGSPLAHEVLGQMAENGLLFEVIPELRAGVGMQQPSSHHLDVFDHCLATLNRMQMVQADPQKYFTTCGPVMEQYLSQGNHRLQLRWAALVHDLGKPATMTVDEDRDGRITFYNHDLEGAGQVEQIGRRLRWRGDDTREVANLVRHHMRPFHLGNVLRQGDLSLKACLRLIRTAEGLLPGLFLLAMADALAGQGEGRPKGIEQEIDTLFARLEMVRRENVEPVRIHPPLISGKDLIGELQLEPGPIFQDILDHVEEAHMEKRIASRREALELARLYYKMKKDTA